MNSSKTEKLKDFLIITKIRITNFVKEHKYVSAVIGLFLISAIVALAVNAEGEETSAEINTPTLAVTTSNPNNKANNFSVVNYAVKYEFANPSDSILDKVYITLELEDNYKYAKWQDVQGEEGKSTSDGKTITITQDQVKMSGSQTVVVPLVVLNAEKDQPIKISKFSVKPGTNGDSNKKEIENPGSDITTTYDDTKSTNLSVLAISGLAKKNSDDSRNAKYGLVLGYDSNIQNLEGYHINNLNNDNELLIYLKGSDANGNNLNILTTTTDEDDNYGVYNSDKHYFNNLPILTTGKTDSLEEKSTVPPFELLDDKTVHFDKQQGDFEYQSKVKINGEIKDCNSENNCSIEGLSNVNLNSDGSYEIFYKLNNNEATKIKQTIVVDNVDEDKIYALNGPKALKYFGSSVSISNFTNLYGVNKIDEADETNYSVTVEYKKNNNVIATCELSDDQSSQTGYTCRTSQTFENDTQYTQKFTIKNMDKGEETVEEIERQVTIVSTTSSGAGETYYELKLSDIILSNLEKQVYTSNNRKIYNGSIISNDKSINVLGSYYVTVKTPSLTGDYNVLLQASTNLEELNNSDKVVLQTKKNQTGTNYANSDIYVNESDEFVKVGSEEKTGLTGNYYTAAVGEKVEVVSSYHYGLDADDNLEFTDRKLFAVIDVHDNLTPTALVENVGEVENFYKVDIDSPEGEINSNIEVEFCTADDNCSETLSEETTIKKIKFYIKTIEEKPITPGSTITITTDYIVKKPDNLTTNSNFNSNVTFTLVEGETKTVTSLNTYITPYKLRGALQLGTYEDEEFISGIDISSSSNKTYTASSSMDIISPIMEKHPDIFGYEQIDKVPVKFTLPKGVMYISNDNYQMQPDLNGGVVYNSDGTTTLTYTYVGVEPNSYYEPILFDFTIDVAQPSDTDLVIREEIINESTELIKKDLSSSSYRNLEKTFKVINEESISYGQYIYDSSNKQLISTISEDSEFVLETKLYNNKGITTSADVVTVMPYNDAGESSFNGNYSIKFENEVSGLLCTNSVPNSLKASINSNGIWRDCNEFKNGDWYSGVTAIKSTHNFSTAGETKEIFIKIKPSGNESLDTYKFNSYISYIDPYETKEDEKLKIHTFEPVKVTVMSKTITGVAWEEFNGNNIMDDDEKRLDNVTFHLYDAEDNTEVKEPVMPNKNGVYSFTGLEVGKYYIVAEYNNDKYGYISSPDNYHDASKVSVFIADSTEVIGNKSQNVVNTSETDNNTQDCDPDEDPDCEPVCDPDEDPNCEPGEDPGDEPGEDPGDEPGEDPGDEPGDDDSKDDDVVAVIKTGTIEVTENTRIIRNQNLGLRLKKKFQPKLNKYITRAEVTNALGVVTRTDFGNAKLAKLNVKNMGNLNIKVVYTLEIENVKYYPGYVKLVTETIPEGMAFNVNYSENSGWILHEDGTITNSSLANTVINEGEKKYLTIAFDITSKEAGSFINLASVDEFEVLGGVADED